MGTTLSKITQKQNTAPPAPPTNTAKPNASPITSPGGAQIPGQIINPLTGKPQSGGSRKKKIKFKRMKNKTNKKHKKSKYLNIQNN
jgi:hypothetical protein